MWKMENNDPPTVIAGEVSGFCIDSEFGILFVVSGIRVRFLELFKGVRLQPFMETSEVVIGALPYGSIVVSLPAASSRPFSATLTPFFDLSVVSELHDPDKAAMTVRRMPNIRCRIRQVAVFALRQKMGGNCLQFLSHFPEEYKNALSSALRAVESPERQSVFEILGPPSHIFMDFACLSRKEGGLISFEQRRAVSAEDMQSAALLLPVIMEEEGPRVAFPATLFVLSKLHCDLDYLESLMRFLDPLLAEVVEREDGKLDCVGMVLERDDYNGLKFRLQRIVEDCMIDALVKLNPNLMFHISLFFRADLRDFLARNRSMDSGFDVMRLISDLARLNDRGEIWKKELRNVYLEMEQAGWKSWSLALMLICGDFGRVSQILRKDVVLKKLFEESEWQHLIDA
jgi:hypothetical protein